MTGESLPAGVLGNFKLPTWHRLCHNLLLPQDKLLRPKVLSLRETFLACQPSTGRSHTRLLLLLPRTRVGARCRLQHQGQPPCLSLTRRGQVHTMLWIQKAPSGVTSSPFLQYPRVMPCSCSKALSGSPQPRGWKSKPYSLAFTPSFEKGVLHAGSNSYLFRTFWVCGLQSQPLKYKKCEGTECFGYITAV